MTWQNIVNLQCTSEDVAFYPAQTSLDTFMWAELAEDKLTVWSSQEHNVRMNFEPHKENHITAHKLSVVSACPVSQYMPNLYQIHMHVKNLHHIYACKANMKLEPVAMTI